MTRQISEAKKKQLAAGPPHRPPLQVPAGGGATRTPYPDYDVARADKWQLDWDGKTRHVIAKRVQEVPPYLFFGDEEGAILEALCMRALPQDDRLPEERVPIAPYIDERLYKGNGNGYRYAGMPADRIAYKQALVGFNQTAQALFGAGFAQLDAERQDEVMRQVAKGSPPGDVWQALPAKRFFQLLVNDVISFYYAHPKAWSEIGFNGPASPRGHIRLSLGSRDPWEAEEKRPLSSVEIVRWAKMEQQKTSSSKGK